MSKGLVIVESPAKAKTIQKYLGAGFEVEASLGHIKDLPKKSLGVDLDNEFATEYEVIPGKEKVIARLKKLAKSAETIYLAPDPDREGEAIAAHLAEELGGERVDGKKLKKGAAVVNIRRVTFNEITKKAVQDAFLHPRDIDRNLVDAQQTRRVLDRLVGYQVSPLLWDKVRRGLSAGRVQTVALRLIVEREREIKAFVKEEYWTIAAHLLGSKPPQFTANFIGIGDEKTPIPNGEEAEKLRAALENADWSVRSVDKRERRRNAAAPFTTSKLQQDSSRKLRFSVKRTMMIAQRLYEGIDLGDEGTVGLITYMRTDSTRVSNDAIAEVREHIGKEYGKEFLPETPNAFKSKKDTQDAHEAIRPTSASRNPEEIKQYLQEDEFKVYKLIWQRFVASQMNPAVFDQTTVDIDAKSGGVDYRFRVTGSVLKFEGFLKVYEESKDSKDEEDEALKHKLPALTEGQKLTLKALDTEQHFTEPPPRFNEASLVKELEERGIGRPSTYSAIISTIQERQYVQKVGGKFIPTEIGLVVTDLLVENFKDIFDLQYTARLEEELDEIEDGKELWKNALAEFYAEVREGPPLRRKAHGEREADGEAHRREVRTVRLAAGHQVGQARLVLRVQFLRQDRSQQLHVYEREPDRSAGPRFGGPAGDDAGGILRELRPSDGAQARAIRPVHGLHGISGLQDHAPSRPGEEGARHSAGREVPAVRTQPADPARPLRRIRFVQWLSGLQVRQAEPDWREVSGVQGWRHRRKEGPPRQFLLRLHQLSQVRVHLGVQASGGDRARFARVPICWRRP